MSQVPSAIPLDPSQVPAAPAPVAQLVPSKLKRLRWLWVVVPALLLVPFLAILVKAMSGVDEQYKAKMFADMKAESQPKPKSKIHPLADVSKLTPQDKKDYDRKARGDYTREEYEASGIPKLLEYARTKEDKIKIVEDYIAFIETNGFTPDPDKFGRAWAALKQSR